MLSSISTVGADMPRSRTLLPAVAAMAAVGMTTGAAAATVTAQFETSRINRTGGPDKHVGGAHTCGIRVNHTMWCWGSNQRASSGSFPSAPHGTSRRA